MSIRTPSFRRDRPRTVYATLHRSATDTPYLYLKPVVYSLTDGTPIPPPTAVLEDDEVDIPTPGSNHTNYSDLASIPRNSPLTPAPLRFRKNKQQAKKPVGTKYSPFPSPNTYGPQTIFNPTNLPVSPSLASGPLSSHPVSACTSPAMSGMSPATFGVSFGSVIDSTPSSATSMTSPSFTELSEGPGFGEEECEEYHEEEEEDDGEEDDLIRRQTWRTDRATIGGNRLSTLYEWQAQLAAINEVERQSPLLPSSTNGSQEQQKPRFIRRLLGRSNTTALLKPTKSTKEKSDKKNDNAGLGLGAGPKAYTFEGSARLRDWDDPVVVRARNGTRNRHAVSMPLAAHTDEFDERRRTAYLTTSNGNAPTRGKVVGSRRKKSFGDLLAEGARRVSSGWWGGAEEHVEEAVVEEEEKENYIRYPGPLVEHVGLEHVDTGIEGEEKRVTVIYSPPPELPELILGDEEQGMGVEDMLSNIGSGGW